MFLPGGPRIPVGRPGGAPPGPLGRLRAGKIAFREASKNSIIFDSVSASILDRLGSVLGAQDGSKILPKSIKIEFGRLSFSTSFFSSIFDRFWPQISTPESRKFLKFYWKNSSFLLCAFLKIRSIFNTILVPTWLHFGSQNRSKSIKTLVSKGIKKMIDFCIDF